MSTNNQVENFKELLILGAGGHGRVVAETATALKIFKKILFLDDKYSENENCQTKGNFNIIGPLNKIQDDVFKKKFKYAFVALGEPNIRLSLLEKLKNNGYSIPSLIHPSALLSPSAKIGNGSILLPQSVVCSETNIGDGVIINTSASVDHQCDIHNGVHICPGVNLAGEVVVGEKSWIGIGSCVKECIKIGKDVVVGAGAAVVCDLPDSIIAKGVPAKISNNQ